MTTLRNTYRSAFMAIILGFSASASNNEGSAVSSLGMIEPPVAVFDSPATVASCAEAHQTHGGIGAVCVELACLVILLGCLIFFCCNYRTVGKSITKALRRLFVRGVTESSSEDDEGKDMSVDQVTTSEVGTSEEDPEEANTNVSTSKRIPAVEDKNATRMEILLMGIVVSIMIVATALALVDGINILMPAVKCFRFHLPLGAIFLS